MSRARIVLVLLAVVVLVTSLAGWSWLQRSYGADPFGPAAGTSLARLVNLKVGEPFDLGMQVMSTKTSRSLILRPATFFRGLLAHLSLTHETVTPGGGFIAARGWPPRRLHRYFPVEPLDGYQLRPRSVVTIVLTLVAHRPGTFLVRPVTLHADLPATFGFCVPVAADEPAYGLLCVQVSRAACTEAQRAGPTERGFRHW